MALMFPFAGEPETSLDVQLFRGLKPIPMHSHDFCEFVMVKSGSCVYLHQGREYLLIAGDVFFISPFQEHGYRCDIKTEFYNLQFYPKRLGEKWYEILHEVDFEREDSESILLHDCDKLSALSLIHDTDEHDSLYEAKSLQRIVHLAQDERLEIQELLENIRSEQRRKEIGYEYIKQAFLILILTKIKRITEVQKSLYTGEKPDQKGYIELALSYLNEHLNEEVDFHDLASRLNLSVNYFRTQFKSATGLSPVEYLNRSRIVKSLQYIQETDWPISKIASQVGIYDANYFSRLFKKIMGYSPRYFKDMSK